MPGWPILAPRQVRMGPLNYQVVQNLFLTTPLHDAESEQLPSSDAADLPRENATDRDGPQTTPCIPTATSDESDEQYVETIEEGSTLPGACLLRYHLFDEPSQHFFVKNLDCSLSGQMESLLVVQKSLWHNQVLSEP